MEGRDQTAYTADHESASAMSEDVPEAPHAREGWTVQRVVLRKAANEGFIATCERERRRTNQKAGSVGIGPSMDYESKEYAFSTLAEVTAFLGRALGGASTSRSSSPSPTPSLG